MSISQGRRQPIIELRVVLVSDGRTTHWRFKCSSCGTVLDFGAKAEATRAAAQHASQVHDGDGLVVIPR